VLPIVFETFGTPTAILDVGCGEGHWLDAAAALDVEFVWGADVDAEATEYRWDAEAGTPLPTLHEASGLDDDATGGLWPLALCLETAEHLTPAGGAHLQRELCRVSEMILWSAAIPGQGGDGHINEAWPRHWAEGFDSLGWAFLDPFRDRLWECADVEPWYRQNLLVAVPRDSIYGADAPEQVRSLVDPVTWAHHRGVPAPGR
jgi:hypothetical protein